MKRDLLILLIVVLLFQLPLKPYCQDSTLTLKIEKTLPSGKKKEIYFEPHKKIDLRIKNYDIIEIERIVSINDFSITGKNETVNFNDIIKVHGYKMEDVRKKILRRSLFIVGASMIFIGMMGMAPRYGGSEDYSQWKSYKERHDKFRNIGLIGLSFTIGGTALSIRRSYNTEKDWELKKGYYKYKYTIVNDGPSY